MWIFIKEMANVFKEEGRRKKERRRKKIEERKYTSVYGITFHKIQEEQQLVRCCVG